jgi:hypothetical protein
MSDEWGSASGIEGNYEEDETETAESDPEETKETNRTKKTNIKDEWNGRTIYVPDSTLDEMEEVYLESQLKLRHAGRDEFKKNRHFYPLLVQLGLEALSEADAEEIRARLSHVDE